MNNIQVRVGAFYNKKLENTCT